MNGLNNLKTNKIMTPKGKQIVVEVLAWLCSIIIITAIILIIML